MTRPFDDARADGQRRRPALSVAPLGPSDPTQVGAYEFLGLLGRRGMDSVYLARSASGRLVAVKVVNAHLAGDPQFLRLFDREAGRPRAAGPERRT